MLPIKIFTDGGCDLKRQGCGAWAYRYRAADGSLVEKSGALMDTTNNRMEMRAAINALASIPIGTPCVLVTDSQYVSLGLTEWSEKWIANGWQTSDEKPVKNKDLWLLLVALYEQHTIKVEWVKGHSGHVDNDRVDRLCTVTMADAYKQYLAGTFSEIDVRGTE